MSDLKRIRFKAYIVFILFVTVPAVLAGYEAWDYWSEDSERHNVKNDLLDAPSNRNIKTIKEIQENVAEKENFSFIVIGDTHQNFTVFNKIIQYAHRHNPDFIIHTGDFTNNGHYSEYTKMIDFLEDINIPLIVCVGNHDLELYGDRCFSHLFGPLNFFFDLNGCRFVFLNNVERSVNTDVVELPDTPYAFKLSRGIDKHLVAYLERLIQHSSRNFIVMHIPPAVKPFDFYCFKRNGESFIRAMTENAERIARVFFGHIHGYGEARFQNVTYIQAGGGSTCDSDFKRDRAGIINRHNYVLVTVSPATVNHTVYFID